MKKRHLILAVLAVVLVLSTSIGAAFAYFTAFTEAKGGYVIHLRDETEIYEEWKNGQKVIQIGNKARTNDDIGKYPVFVRVKIYAGSDVSITEPTDTGWVKDSEGYYRYQSALYCGNPPAVDTNSLTTPLNVKVDAVSGQEYKVGDTIDVIVVYQSVPAVFMANGEPDLDTAWATGNITVLNGGNG